MIDVTEIAAAILTSQFALNENRLTIKLINYVINEYAESKLSRHAQG